MAEWKKRLSKEDVALLADEITAATKAGGFGSLRKLANLAGLNDSMLHHIRSGTSGTTVPTALRIRNAIRTLLAMPKPAPIALPAATNGAAQGTHGNVGRFQILTTEQEPLRMRLRGIMDREKLSQSEVGRRAGMHSSVVSYFLSGKCLQSKNLQRLALVLDAASGGEAASAKKTKAPRAAMVQHRLPLAGLNGHGSNGHAGMRQRQQIDVVAARFQTIHEPAQPADAVALAQAFIQRTGLEAIETLLQIAKSNPNGEDPQ